MPRRPHSRRELIANGLTCVHLCTVAAVVCAVIGWWVLFGLWLALDAMFVYLTGKVILD